MRLAGLSAGADRAMRFIERALDRRHGLVTSHSDGRAQFIRLAASVVAARGEREEIAHLLTLAAGVPGDEAWWRAAALQGIGDGIGPALAALEQRTEPLLRMVGDADAAVRRGALRLLARTKGTRATTIWRDAVGEAERVAQDASQDAERRADAVALLALDASPARRPLLRSLIDPRQPDAVQRAAVEALGRDSDPNLGAFLISRWDGLTPPVRSAAADALLRDAGAARLLVAAIREGTVRPWTLSFWQKRDLLMHRDEGIRVEARALLEEDPRERERALQRYATALSGRGDAARGEQVFARACAACHSLGGGAGDLGPDLATVRHRPPLLLLADILEPSRTIAQHYETWAVERVSGGVETGLLAARTPTSITLRQGPGREITIPREDVRTMTSLPESSMPADLDEIVSPEDMADLLAYVKGANERPD